MYLIQLILLLFIVQSQPEGLKVNDEAPDFVITDQNGKKFHLSQELKEGPVIVTFYRGSWCRYCTAQMIDLQDSLNLITGKGASIIAITPDKASGLGKIIDKTGLEFPIARDEGLKVMRLYKTISDDKFEEYLATEESGQDLQHKFLPVPATFVIGKNGKVIYRYFDPNYKVRPSVRELIDAL